MADPALIDRKVPPGPLGREQRQCDFAKRAVTYAAQLAVQNCPERAITLVTEPSHAITGG